MSGLQSLPPVGLIVIVSIVALFVLAVLLLFYVSARYKHFSSMVTGNPALCGQRLCQRL